MKVRASVVDRGMSRGLYMKHTDIPITSSDFWQNEDECTEEVLSHVFRSATEETMPMLKERIAILREAGQILYEVCSNHTTNHTKLTVSLIEIPLQFR